MLDRLDLNQLRFFSVFGKVKSFSETARVMHVTQSAVSHSLKKLQQAAGVQLIERKGKEYQFTEPGRDLFYSCEKIFSELQQAQENLNKYREEIAHQIYIGSQVEFGTTILVPHIARFMQQHPEYHIDFLFSHYLEHPLVAEEVDFIIDCKQHFTPQVEKFFLFDEPYVVVAAPHYIKQHSIDKPADLAQINIISLDKQTKWWNNFLVALKAEQRPEFHRITQLNHVRGMIYGALEGIGVSFLPRYTVLEELQNGRLQELFPEIQPKADQFCIYIKTSQLKLTKNKTVVEYLQALQPIEFG